MVPYIHMFGTILCKVLNNQLCYVIPLGFHINMIIYIYTYIVISSQWTKLVAKKTHKWNDPLSTTAAASSAKCLTLRACSWRERLAEAVTPKGDQLNHGWLSPDKALLGFEMVFWLVVYQPLWKIWVCEWEGWHPIYEIENKTCLKPPTSFSKFRIIPYIIENIYQPFSHRWMNREQ